MMCRSDSTPEAPDSMTDSSRTRSDSLEASSLQQDRKRPRLDSGSDDGLQSEETLTESGSIEPPASSHPADLSDPHASGGAYPPDSPSPTPSTMQPSLNLPLSKVTINTRSAASDAADVSGKTADSPEATLTSREPPTPADPSPASADGPNMVALQPDAISIRSSPSRSPEIQIAVVEDIDQDPAETSWAPVARLNDSNLQDQADPYYVNRTFPFSAQTAPGYLHEILTEIGKMFLQGGEQDGYIFNQLKDWLLTFLAVHPRLTQRLVHEERAFWDEFPETVNCLLRRLIDVPAEACTSDLEEFFIAYGQLAVRFLDLDLQMMNQCKALDTPEKLSDLYSRPYLPTLALLLQYREVPFYTLLHANRGFNILDLVSAICDNLTRGPSGILPTLTAFLDALGFFLPRQPAFTPAFVQTLAIAHALAHSGTERESLPASERSTASPTVQKINHQVLRLCMKADEVLQNAISKQLSWLTIENSPDILRFLSSILLSISTQDQEIAAQLMTYVSDVTSETPYRDLPEIIAYAWKFKTLRRYITAGRMELRVYGMDSIRIDLINVWKSHGIYGPNSLSVPMIRFLVQFLRDYKMVQYIVGVDSHPQLIARSANVVGFLVVTETYCDEDSDVIWRTVKESQDPRTVSEVLNMLKSIFHMQTLPTLLHLCCKLLELPVEHYDAKMVDYTEALLLHIRDKAMTQPRHGEHLNAVPFKVCVRLIRDVIASDTCSPEQKCRLPSWAADNLARLLAFNVDAEDKRHLWEKCVQDIAQKTPFATGSLRALQAWLGVHPDLEVPTLTHDFDFTRLLVDELVDCFTAVRGETSSSTVVQMLLPTRLCLLALIAQYAPDTVTQELTEKLWSEVFAGQGVHVSLRNMAWDIVSGVATYCVKPNSMIDRLMTDYLPRLEASSLNDQVLCFAQNSVLYESRLDKSRELEDENIVSLPGIERVWRFVMECPAGTVEKEATSWIIKQYLDHDVVLRRPRRVVEATHLSLVDGCLSKVFSSASKLRSFSGGTVSGEDETMVVVVSEDEVKAEERRLTRSLLFLRGFLEGVRSRPRYSPPLAVESRPPRKSFQHRGDEVTIDYQIVPIPGTNTPSVQKKLAIGDLNTVDELTKYLSDLTGFTQFTGISRGQKLNLIGNETTIRESKVGMGNLLVQKVPDTPERQPASGTRSASSMDDHIMNHFSQFYDLLELEEPLSREVYAFLDLFPPQPLVTDLVRAQEPSLPRLLPSNKPYKLLYGLNALRLCVEDEALGSAPNEDFMKFSVHSLIMVLNRSETKEKAQPLQLSVSNLLVECLLLALRAQVSPATSKEYFSACGDLAIRLIDLTLGAAEYREVEHPSAHAQSLVRHPFAVLIESALQDAQIRSEISSNGHLGTLLQRTMMLERRLEVRKAIADVISDLTGHPSTKLVFHKVPDPRSARSRFPSERIEEVLRILWQSLVKILPESYSSPSTSRQVFEISLAIFRIIGKSMNAAEVTACFQQWGKLLVSYDYQEIVGKSKDDHVIWGFAALLKESFGLIQALRLDIETGTIAQSIFDTFLYPSANLDDPGASKNRIPVLQEDTREDLYSLVLSFTKHKADYDSTVNRLDGLVVKEAFPEFPPHIQSERQALRSEIGYAGLRNLSNTCYLNSLFSQLFMNLKFRDFIFAMDRSQAGKPSQLLLCELSRLFASIQNRWDKYVDTTDAVSSIETYDNEQIDVSIQMDVDEFFNLLFDRLEGQISSPEDKNAFRSLYGGQLVQQIKSRECEHISERLEPFSAIQCEIKGKMTLEDSLRAYVEGEVMQGDNKYSCTSCNRHVDAVKRACFKDLPNHLIFNLKRFDFDITTMTRCKVNDEFRFPDSIDMAPYNVEQLSNSGKPNAPDIFGLVGILVHSGTAESGHYYSYIRERPSSRFALNSWVQFNDIEVSGFDPQRIPDCCYGGVELASALQLPKSHSAYMLFYQRVASIHQFEAEYDNHDFSNPVRLPIDESLDAEIDARNRDTIRSYCLQDSTHARFMRVMLEKMRWSAGRQCSDSHVSEDQMIRYSLDYIHQISCRFKEMPEFDATCKLLHEYAQECFYCACRVAAFFADTGSGDEAVPREGVLRCAILRSPSPPVRRSFGGLLCQALHTMKQGSNKQECGEEEIRSREARYREAFTCCIGNLAEPWPEMHKFARAWNEFFELLSRLTAFGPWEAGVLLHFGFLRKVGEIIWADARHDPMELRAKYAAYVNGKEKGRPYGFSGLIMFLSTILEYVHFNSRCDTNSFRMPNDDGFYDLSMSEAQLLRPLRTSQKQRPSLEWLRRIMMTKQNPNAVTKMVASLLQESVLAAPLESTLAHGLATESVSDAVAFLDPAIAFCRHCQNPNLVRQLVKEALGGIDSIGGSCGKEHLDFITELSDLENESAGMTRKDFFTLVFRYLKNWAPTLLLFPDDIHYDVRGDTTVFLQDRLLRPLDDPDMETSQEDTLTSYARSLARACVGHIQHHHIPRSGKQVARIEVGQATHISRIIQYVCEHFFNSGDAAEDQFVTEAMATLEHLHAFTQEAAEAASADWPDNESVPVTDSDTGEFADWHENA